MFLHTTVAFREHTRDTPVPSLRFATEPLDDVRTRRASGASARSRYFSRSAIASPTRTARAASPVPGRRPRSGGSAGSFDRGERDDHRARSGRSPSGSSAAGRARLACRSAQARAGAGPARRDPVQVLRLVFQRSRPPSNGSRKGRQSRPGTGPGSGQETRRPRRQPEPPADLEMDHALEIRIPTRRSGHRSGTSSGIVIQAALPRNAPPEEDTVQLLQHHERGRLITEPVADARPARPDGAGTSTSSCGYSSAAIRAPRAGQLAVRLADDRRETGTDRQRGRRHEPTPIRCRGERLSSFDHRASTGTQVNMGRHTPAATAGGHYASRSPLPLVATQVSAAARPQRWQ